MYVVHANQASAIERAQGLVSLNVTTRAQRDAIAAAMKGVRMGRGFGDTLDRLIRNGVGVHHAGMLPRYRRLVERLAGEGLLPVICGTDTLGVGVNIPIRTVLMTALTKFDGSRVRLFSVREFHQLAGRAGRPGFDPDGHVWVQAPDHVIENSRALSRAGDDPKARRKAAKARPPEGFVNYDEASMQRLISARPEPLVSRFRVTADLVATVLGRPDGPNALKHLLRTNHDTDARKRQHRKRAIAVYRSLEAAGVAERRRDDRGRCIGVRVGSLVEGDDERAALRFSAPLMPFAIEVVATMDRDDPTYLLDAISVVESVLDDPRQILYAQQNAAKGAEVARLKAEGVPYEERMERLESITWPRPLAELLDECFTTYRQHHPWVAEGPSPKSILREMLESGDSFSTFVRRYRLERSEGPGAALPDRRVAHPRPEPARRRLHPRARGRHRLARRAHPRHRRHAARRVGGAGRQAGARAPGARRARSSARPGRPQHGGRRCARPRSVGSSCSLRVRTLALAERSGWDERQIADAMQPYWAEYDAIEIDADARAATAFSVVDEPDGAEWIVTQRLADPAGDGEWRFVATRRSRAGRGRGCADAATSGRLGRFDSIHTRARATAHPATSARVR